MGALGQGRLDHADPAFAEAPLAVGEVELPEPPEALVIAEALRAVRGAEEALAPAPQRLGIVLRDVLASERPHVGHPLDAVVDDRRRRKTTGREHELPDEAVAGLLGLIGRVIDHDRLEQHRAARVQQLVAALEEAVEVLPAHGLDHLDRHELVVAPGEVPVVLGDHPHAVREPGDGHPLHRRGVLLGRDRGGGHAAAVAPRGMQGE